MRHSHCRSCGSCGFPLRAPSDFAGAKPDAEYCSTCGDHSGQLKTYDDVLQANANYLVRQQGLDPQAARTMAAALLASMPAWRDRV
jgi:Putative zinc ribbon domain